MKKIGIITHHYINNFGAFLQTYALQSAVKELCPEARVQVINYINPSHALINTLGWFRFYNDKETVGAWLRKIRLPMTFSRARRKYLDLTKKVYTAAEVNKMDFDAILIGSDEVWNYVDKKSVDTIKFGHGLNCKNIIAYAPSAGQAAKTAPPDFVREGIKNFSHLSARDRLTLGLIESLGEKGTRVLDPTFLAPVPYEDIPVKKPYILFYYCQNMPKETVEAICRFAKEKGLSLYGAGECDKAYADVTVNLTPFQWTGMFKNAEYVITGTFHGVIFAILNKKRFACYMTNPSRVEKVNSLLEELELSDRRFGKDTDVVGLLEKNIDYDATWRIIEERAELSKEYLKNSLADKKERGEE